MVVEGKGHHGFFAMLNYLLIVSQVVLFHVCMLHKARSSFINVFHPLNVNGVKVIHGSNKMLVRKVAHVLFQNNFLLLFDEVVHHIFCT